MEQKRNVIHKMETLLNQAPCGIGLYDSVTSIPVFLNDAYYQIIGYSREEYEPLMNDIDALMFKSDISVAHKSQKDYEQSGSGTGYQYRIVRKDGQIRWVKLNMTTVEIDGKNYAFATFVDYTQEHEAYTQLHTVAENVDGSISMLQVSKEKSELLYANSGFYRMIGVSPEEYQKNTPEFNRFFYFGGRL